jgi:hypothetical protein
VIRPPFRIITPDTLAAGVAEAWRRQYAATIAQGRPRADQRSQQLAALLAMDPPTAEKVKAILGNDSWAQTQCDHCGAEGLPVVEVGGPMDYEPGSARLCRDCLFAAVAAIDGWPGGGG